MASSLKRAATIRKPSSSTENVKVSVRVRPLNSKEVAAGTKVCVEMMDDVTILHDPMGVKEPRAFGFDFCHWSCDGYITSEDGTLQKDPNNPHSHYVDQAQVFCDLGLGAVDNVFKGYNAAIFAYGQTGAGKSYSMIGYGDDEGIIPRLCHNLFERCSEASSSSATKMEHQITFSMLEVYNERIRDLMATATEQPTKGLKLRQHPKTGFYVEGLKKVAVSSFEDVRLRMDRGNLHRTTASTVMNEVSSRSHMVVSINVKQVFLNQKGQSTTKYSDIHLVDLAGSERVVTAGTGAMKDRLSEGAAINQSLSALGNVISALAEQSSGKKETSVPYRNSVLTKLLKNALGGNSKTMMLAAISPASSNYEETLSTLRYADRAKQIQTTAIVNESPTDKLIRELREENARLMDALASGGLSMEMQEHMEANEQELTRQMHDMETTWSQRLQQAKQEWEAEVQASGGAIAGSAFGAALEREAHLSNVNQDPLLSHVLKHPIRPGVTIFGRSEQPLTRTPSRDGSRQEEGEDTIVQPEPGSMFIELPGPAILEQHAMFERRNDEVTLTSFPNANVVVNGQALTGPRVLDHLDRVVLGAGHAFLYFAPQHCRRVASSKVDVYDYDFIQMEIASAHGLSELFRVPTDLDAYTSQLRQQLLMLSPMVSHANAISAELSKRVKFDIIVKSGAAHSVLDHTKDALVVVTHLDSGLVWHWDRAKFVNRYNYIQSWYNDYLTGQDLSTNQEDDPFWDPPEDVFVGSSLVYLQPLAYGVNVDEEMPVCDYRGVSVGRVKVHLTLCDTKGKEIPSFADIGAPSDMLNRRIDILLRITYGRHLEWLDGDSTRGLQCKYRFYTDTKMRSTKPVFKTSNPQFGYSKQFTIRSCSESFITYLNTNALVIEVWGKPGDGKQRQVDACRSTTSMVASRDASHRPSLDMAMDSVLQETSWLEEKRRMQVLIDELQQEIEFLTIEKGALEKEVSSITLRSASATMARGMGTGSFTEVYETLHEFVQLQASIQKKLQVLDGRAGEESGTIGTLQQDASRLQSKAAAIQRMLQASITDSRSAIAELSNEC
eukprot:m.53616 g.53616  ORF g.53616 m.53616 type:complete len:1064 (+) comp11374_c1_seq1:292-3483(+)